MQRNWFTIGTLVIALGLLGSAFATAQDKSPNEERSVSEEILDILRSREEITEEQYDDLLRKAKAEKEKPETFRLYWNKGIRLDSHDQKFRIRMGGRLQNDWAVFDADNDTETFFSENFGSGTEFRRVRFYIDGTIYGRYVFKTQYDFADGKTTLKDIYVGVNKLPVVGNFKVGHYKEPFSLEDQTSSKYITFMERSLPNAFAPGRNTGIMFNNTALDQRLTWGVGVFRETENSGGEAFGDEDEYNLTARVTGTPWYTAEGRRVLHFGLSYNHKFRDEKDGTTVRFRSRPESHISPVYYVDTGDILTDGVDLINPELALLIGPFSLQGEYIRAFVDSDAAGDPEFEGYYVSASYFLTGEHRPYTTKGKGGGAFGRPIPKRNFLADGGGWGAWEVGLRYSNLDLADAGVSGGELDDITVGLNWHLNPNVRVMFNYIYADLDSVGETNIYQMRFQVDF